MLPAGDRGITRPFTSILPRTRQLVEKVGFELVATTNRVLNGPKAASLVSFGAGPGVRMATKGVFQHAGVFSEICIQDPAWLKVLLGQKPATALVEFQTLYPTWCGAA